MGTLNDRKTIRKKDDRGEYLVCVGEVADVEKAREERDQLEREGPPPGYHFWLGAAKRSSRGLRGIFEVWWRKTEKGRGRR